MFERFTKSAKTAIVTAQEDARELGSSSINVEHVLLGVLAHSDADLKALLAAEGLTYEGVMAALAPQAKSEPLGEEDAEALRSIGIDLDAVRESLEATFGEDALDRAIPEERRGPFGWGRVAVGHIPFSKDAKKVLELSLREALGRKDKTIESGHVLLGILRAPNQTTVRLFGGPGHVHDLRPKVHALLDRAA
ncbi:Clp protease N-terminal domain-containing protein [Nocardia altamirensis]|uniref:Clp protease N-terminal domain-containing protein n=1 Tax=Nocardia altamirensis TaxID=472158 RepID=UPI0008404EAA|nr:Clp protease N-terminal domain-containing protein [Nocardia altamirensis]